MYFVVGKPEYDWRQRRMRWSRMWLCAWPGLARLWLQGHWRSLAVAVTFGVALNATLVATVIWPELLGESFALIAWPVLLAAWLIGALISGQNVDRWSRVPSIEARRAESPPDDSNELADTLFIRAQREYLKGHWTEATTLLARQLQQHPRDIESRLLLATMMRRRQRWDLAREQLAILRRFDESVNWKHEIDWEQELIDRDEAEDKGVSDEVDDSEETDVSVASIASDAMEADEESDHCPDVGSEGGGSGHSDCLTPENASAELDSLDKKRSTASGRGSGNQNDTSIRRAA